MPTYRLEHLTFGGAFLLTLNGSDLMWSAALCNPLLYTYGLAETRTKGRCFAPGVYTALIAIRRLHELSPKILDNLSICLVIELDLTQGWAAETAGFDPMYGGRAVHTAMRSCVNVSGPDWSMCSGPSWISARMRSHQRTSLERACLGQSVRTRWEG